MRRVILIIAACFLIFQNVAPVDALDSKGPGLQSSDLPRAFLPKSEGNVNVVTRQQGGSILLSYNKSSLEEILQKIAQVKKLILKFYCNDPGLKHERATNLRISGNSVVEVLRQLLSEDHQFTLLNREGKPAEDGTDIATINVYPKQCAAMDHPVRVFIAEGEHPLLRKRPEEISLEELGDVLKREGPTSRSRAANILGMKGDEKGIPYAKEALKDENVTVMFAALNALGRLGKKYGSEKVVDAIYERFREKPYAEFLLAGAVLDKEKIWPIIEGFMDQSGEREQGIMARVLVLTNDRRAIKYLSRIASAGSMENSRQVIYGIGKIGGPEAAAFLMKLLREGDAQRQATAAQAVHFLPKDDGLDVRAEVEKIVREESVSDVLLYALAQISYLEPLEKLMKDPASKPELKIRALKAMGSRGINPTIEVMSIGLNDKSLQVRFAAVEALRVLAAEAAIPYLIRGTEDKDAKVRRGAVKGLSEFYVDGPIVEALGKAIDDTDENVRREAVDALGRLGKPSEAMIAILRNCNLNHKDPYVANKAGSILTRWGLK